MSKGSLRLRAAAGYGIGLLASLVLATLVSLHTAWASTDGTTPWRPASGRWNPQCADPAYPASRQGSNPLMLAATPSQHDPLRGARFFVAGPRYGDAAGAIARLLAGPPSDAPLQGYPAAESWTTFAQTVHARLTALTPRQRRTVDLLEKIAVEPQAERISAYSGGGSPPAIYSQTRHLFCAVLSADPGSIPIISTYFLHATLGGCANDAEINTYRAAFQAQIDAAAQAIGSRPAVLLVEVDGVGSSSCMARLGSLPAWESMLRYEALSFEALPHTAVYLEGGYSDNGSPAYAARVLNASGVRRIQGFFTNDTHENWTSSEVRYGTAVSKLTGGAHFIVNTAANGRGPLRNPDPRTDGLNDLCNPPGRGLGPRDTTSTPWALVDALLWTHTPGNSSGPCRGGPASGTFWPQFAEGLAARANGRYGPLAPSQPY